MNGIVGTIGGQLLADNAGYGMSQYSLSIDEYNFSVQLNTLNKFINDKLLYEDDNFAILLDGVIFNKKELQTQKSWSGAIMDLYQQKGRAWFGQLRGSFYGLYVDKHNRKLYLFVDQVGDKPIYYCQVGRTLYFASEQLSLSHLLKENHCQVLLNEGAAYCMLTYGYLLADISYIAEAHRLTAGQFLEYDMETHQIEVVTYHKFAYKQLQDRTENDILEHIHNLFNHAVRLQIDKNAEYAYDDFSALSGGLDSRLTTCTISHLKKDAEVTTFTYAPVGQMDQKLAFQVVQRLPNAKSIYYSTTLGSLLTDIDRSVRINDGMYAYYGTAVLLNMFDIVDKNSIGIVHSGQLGDAVIGSINHSKVMETLPYASLNCITKRFQSKLHNRGINVEYIGNSYGSRELYSLYNRGLGGVIFGANKAFQSFAETFSPFYDVDFWDYCLSIPQELRRNHYLYDKYFIRFFRDYADISHNGDRVIGHGLHNAYTEFMRKAIKRARKMMHIQSQNQSVTPLQQWESVAIIKQALDKYYMQTISIVNISNELREDIAYQYLYGTTLERNTALTLLSVIKQLQS